ncbi:hypothetical protein L596_010380 [Steinernema carpocapsae]|uniref:Uncharacterized protein n=1 Tax=Steinernema carpocapsae TaxID=34508 RepID=A0A4U5PIQ1_STECR|nr:hypothetical protein L596_010380 [Steinernema carpocapsae]
MDSVVHALVDSVAHLLLSNSASLLASLDCSLWSSVGEIHQKKRVDQSLYIFVCDNQTHSCVDLELFPNYLKHAGAYDRITTIDIQLCSGSAHHEHLKSDFPILKKFLSYKLVLDEIIVIQGQADNLPYFIYELVTVPAKTIRFSQLVTENMRFFDWHFKNNYMLKNVSVKKLGSVLPLAELWKKCSKAQNLVVQFGRTVHKEEDYIDQLRSAGFVFSDMRPFADLKHPLDEEKVLTLDLNRELF